MSRPDLHPYPKTTVIGLGNPILGDDGFGWVVAEQVRLQIGQFERDIDVECLSLGGLSLMEHLIGYDRAILIDAMHLGESPQATLYCLPLEDLPDYSAGHTASSHDTTLPNAIKLGRSLKAHLPESITVVGVETQIDYEFSDKLSQPIAEAVPAAVRRVLEILELDVYEQKAGEYA